MKILILKERLEDVDENLYIVAKNYRERGEKVIVYVNEANSGQTYEKMRRKGIMMGEKRNTPLKEYGKEFKKIIAVDAWGEELAKGLVGQKEKPEEEEKPMVAKEEITISEDMENQERVEIVFVRYNNKKVEDKAIAMVKEHTEWPYRLTVVDNYKKKEGLSTVWNRIVKNSKCKYICLINTDAFVTEGWLPEMMRGFTDQDVVAVGASSNFAKGEQGNHTEGACEAYKGQYKEMTTLSGFCMIIKKDVPWIFPKEVPFYGGEDCWCIEARRHGKKLLWAKGAYVEHLGEATAKKEGNYEKMVREGRKFKAKWLAKTSPVLMTTYDRLDYTKQALTALLKADVGKVIVIDNGSTDGTVKWLRDQENPKLQIIYNRENQGIRGAMNAFFSLTRGEEFVGKVDNDTIVPKNWYANLIEMMLERNVDIMQCKHHLLDNPNGSFAEYMKTLNQDEQNPHIFHSDFVGGSGIAIRRTKMNGKLQEASHILYSWFEYQRSHPEMRKAFCDNVEIGLLDMKGHNKPDYGKYRKYYQETGRSGERNQSMKLNIGSGHKPLEGYVNMDIEDYQADGHRTDVVRDILRGIPFDTDKFVEVYTSHFMEHIRNGEDLYFVLHEIWRVLKDGGKFIIRVPHASTPYAFYPDHLSYWNEEVVKAMVGDPFQKSKKHCYNYEIEEMSQEGIELRATLIAKK